MHTTFTQDFTNMKQCFFKRFILTSWSRLQCVVVDKAILSQIALYVLMFDMVWHCFCPQALAEALKVNQTLTNVNLERNDIGTGGAEAWCLGRGSAAPGLETVNENGVKCCTRGVRDLWDCSGVGGLVFGCYASGSFQESFTWEHGMEARWKWNGRSIFKAR